MRACHVTSVPCVTNNGAPAKETEVIASDVVSVRNYSDTDDNEQNADLYIITIDGKEYMAIEGSTLKEAVSIIDNNVINLDEFKTKEGYTFKNFVEKGTDNVVDENTVITKNITIEAVFEKDGEDVKDEVENPKTNDNILIISAVAITSIALIAISVKKILVK